MIGAKGYYIYSV